MHQSPTQTQLGRRTLQRKCACGRAAGPEAECTECRRKRLQRRTMQPKLVIHQPGDPFEREADHAAEAVMTGGKPRVAVTSATVLPETPPTALQRDAGCNNIPETPPTALQRDAGCNNIAAHSDSDVAQIVDQVLQNPGQRLEPSAQQWMEQRFGHNFGRVRVHDDAQAHRAAQVVNARAYTVDADVVFAAGQYAPGTQEGRRLLAHELTHVLQQAHAPAQTPHLQRAPWGTCPPGRRLDARNRFVNFPAELFAVGYYYSQFPNHCILTNEMLAAGEVPQCKEPERTMVAKLMRHFHRDKRPQRRQSVQAPDNVTE
ncbi:MAG: DUF4157 domain-containing protein, partial [Caldilinea sp.]